MKKKSIWAVVAGVLWLTWWLNLFNFMDGIDGLAAGEAIFLAAASAGICIFRGDPALGVIYLALTGASLGFLFYNWPPARIFMGDVGSGSLGFVTAALALIADSRGAIPLSTSLLLLGAFFVDATYTVIRRGLAGERIMSAHRDHAYQHAAFASGHRRVTLGILAVCFFWLLPLALLSVGHPPWRWLLLFMAFVPLLWFEIRLKAGVRGSGA